jgi:hypothetical protein
MPISISDSASSRRSRAISSAARRARSGVVVLAAGSAEDREQAVADELVHVAPVAVDDRHHPLEQRVQAGHGLGRRAPLGEAGEVAHVEEHDRHLDLLAVERGSSSRMCSATSRST